MQNIQVISKAMFIDMAVKHAESKGFHFSSKCLGDMELLIDKGIEFLEQKQGQNFNKWARRAEQDLTNFVDRMIAEAEKQGVTELKESNFFTVRQIFCPSPWCGE
jgi:hypothetical protein